ncbi:MAG: hypothetical protein GY716_04305 [bacterium]|nr:hypothetical protein [bacterium]
MQTATAYSKKQLKIIMERYAATLLEPVSFADLPVTFAYETTQFRGTVSCHLRTTKGIVLEVEELVTWFEKLPAKQQAEILD